MKTTLPPKISSIKEAEVFLTELIKNNEIFHPEDDASDINWNLPKEQQPTIGECIKLNELMAEVYDLNPKGQPMIFDPCEFILSLTNPENPEK